MATENMRDTSFWLQAYGVAGPPIAWILHLAVSYAIVPVSCRTEQSLWLHLVTIGALAMVAGAALSSFFLLRRTQERALDSENNYDFLAYSGLLMAAIFTLAILLGGAANFIVSACDRSV